MTDGVTVQHLLRERVAEEVRALLARKMMTGADLAAAIGRSPMYVSRRVRAEVAFDLDDMERMAEVFGVPVTQLMPAADAATQATGSRSAHLPRRVGPNDSSSRLSRLALASPPGGPFGQKPGGSTRPGSSVRRPVLIGPGRRAI